MIVRDAPRPLDLIFAMRGSILPRILPHIAIVTLWSAAVAWLHQGYGLLPEAGGVRRAG
jgi:putative membrane protein